MMEEPGSEPGSSRCSFFGPDPGRRAGSVSRLPARSATLSCGAAADGCCVKLSADTGPCFPTALTWSCMPDLGWRKRGPGMWRRRLSECCPRPSEGSTEPGRGRSRTLSQHLALALLGAYKAFLSPLTLSSCKFYPTCSEYARQAIERHGLVQGVRLTAARLLRCRPFSPGGIDPVPEKMGGADA